MSSITPTEVGSFFISLLVPIITGVVAAGFTAFFALNRFYREKWWEKKHAAYGQLIDILIEMKSIYALAVIHHERIYEAEQRLQDVPDYYFDWSRFNDLRKQLRRSFILAPISLSDNTKELLDDFFSLDASAQEAIHDEGYPEQAAYGDMAKDVEDIISLIVEDAKTELNFN
ncbi:TPA: hypothetical protein PJH99_000155 [Raoultella ornithinolytica]|nr:hypothetical protein [Raoultella ornithinolytica]HDG9797726.1 hypothetical protein [Raoultella ornithinolytica]HDG9800592.1 hypothetical protein [Raoultella ornithinolytica]HDG9835412.1 hypothetical protein [Raoultella ornithinolytica]HDH7811703.1 hypothetical protein [Raoultella ornithinolytica]